ncbi:MAG: alpha-ketoacid dehydrogenase subunit beta [Deltaproteobacteria bacterium]|nr:alpha-ketoacid dehydrogenase subunit beta [Deltaproteobacteria bacterium]MBM4347827.1 alpha-ketoacid dehydrogenase subunit beta [Deltaproteobacteria bacterium]
MPRLNLVEAINLALREEMEKDKTIVVLGEDVGREGGVFRVTDGLQTKFGDERVVDTPLAETGIVGTALGMALYGLRPVVEIQFDGFLYPCLDQITNHIGRMRNRSRGRFTCPFVIRVPYGGGIHAPEHHSESPEAILAHTPGIKVVIPSTPYEAKGLLLSSIRSPDPVIFLEPKRIYRAIREDVSEGDYTIPLGKARLVQEGKDATVIAWGAMVREVLNAAEELKGDKIALEIIDLRTISPMDVDAIITSVRKTGRAVVVHEAPKTCGLGAEIIAVINEKAFLSLQAPIERVTGFDIPVPLLKSEHYYLPNPKRIVMAVKKVMSF